MCTSCADQTRGSLVQMSIAPDQCPPAGHMHHAAHTPVRSSAHTVHVFLTYSLAYSTYFVQIPVFNQLKWSLCPGRINGHCFYIGIACPLYYIMLPSVPICRPLAPWLNL